MRLTWERHTESNIKLQKGLDNPNWFRRKCEICLLQWKHDQLVNFWYTYIHLIRTSDLLSCRNTLSSTLITLNSCLDIMLEVFPSLMTEKDTSCSMTSHGLELQTSGVSWEANLWGSLFQEPSRQPHLKLFYILADWFWRTCGATCYSAALALCWVRL